MPTMDNAEGIKASLESAHITIESVPASQISPSEDNLDLASNGNVSIVLGWRSWVAVFITCFACMSQIFVVVAVGSVMGFIIRDLKEPSIAGWLIQGPLLMQAVLSPIMGRLSDVTDRKYLASVPPLIAFAGAVLSAKAANMSVLIGGGILIGVTLSTVGIIQAIPSEILPLKYRALANGFTFIAGSLGGLIGVLCAGGLANMSPSGWRGIFWMQAAFHLATALGLIFFYNPPPLPNRPKLSIGAVFWACDPIGSFLFMGSCGLMMLALSWAGGSYLWSDIRVAAPLGLGAGLLVLFCFYEWKGRSDGIVAHVFFKDSPNFALSVFAFTVEGWIFYSAVNNITPLIVLNLSFEKTSWDISIRQLDSILVNLFAAIPIIWYATIYKDMKLPLLVTFAIFLVVSICYSTITPSMGKAQYGFNILTGIGQAGPLTLLVALVQFTSPHSYLSTATGLAFSARAVGGAFGSAVLDVIINNKLSTTYVSGVSSAALNAGLPESSIELLLSAINDGNETSLANIAALSNGKVLQAAMRASHDMYAGAYRLAWSSIIPFVVLAIVAVWFLKGVEDLMTEEVNATMEHVAVVEEKGV